MMWVKTCAFYFSFAVVGAIVGFGSWYFQFSEFKAIKTIALDRIDIPGSPTQYAVDPIILVETIKSRGFADRIDHRLGLSKTVYQNIGIRNLGGNPPTAIEIRLKMATAYLARDAMEAVGAEIALIQSNKTQMFLDALSQSIPVKVRLSGEINSITAGNEQAALYQVAINKALVEAAIRVRTGQSAETSVFPPSGPGRLTSLGALGMLSLAMLMRVWRI